MTEPASSINVSGLGSFQLVQGVFLFGCPVVTGFFGGESF